MARTLVIACGLALAMAGCVSPGNDRLTIGESVRLEAFTAQREKRERLSEQVSAPSLLGVGRGNWAPTVVLVPADGTAHYPTYARRVTWADKVARQRGEMPTAFTALELFGGSEEQQENEALNNHFRAFTDLLLIVPRALVWTPWQSRKSPDEAYQRYWHPERPEPAPATTGGVQSVSP